MIMKIHPLKRLVAVLLVPAILSAQSSEFGAQAAQFKAAFNAHCSLNFVFSAPFVSQALVAFPHISFQLGPEQHGGDRVAAGLDRFATGSVPSVTTPAAENRSKSPMPEAPNRESPGAQPSDPGAAAKPAAAPDSGEKRVSHALPLHQDLIFLEHNTENTWRVMDRETQQLWYLKIDKPDIYSMENAGYGFARDCGVNIPRWGMVPLERLVIPESYRNDWANDLTHYGYDIESLAQARGLLTRDAYSLSASELAEPEGSGGRNPCLHGFNWGTGLWR